MRIVKEIILDILSLEKELGEKKRELRECAEDWNSTIKNPVTRKKLTEFTCSREMIDGALRLPSSRERFKKSKVVITY